MGAFGPEDRVRKKRGLVLRNAARQEDSKQRLRATSLLGGGGYSTATQRRSLLGG